MAALAPRFRITLGVRYSEVVTLSAFTFDARGWTLLLLLVEALAKVGVVVGMLVV